MAFFTGYRFSLEIYMGVFDCVDVSHKDKTRFDESNTCCLSSIALLSCDEWPVVTSPSRYSRYVLEFQAV